MPCELSSANKQSSEYFPMSHQPMQQFTHHLPLAPPQFQLIRDVMLLNHVELMLSPNSRAWDALSALLSAGLANP